MFKKFISFVLAICLCITNMSGMVAFAVDTDISFEVFDSENNKLINGVKNVKYTNDTFNIKFEKNSSINQTKVKEIKIYANNEDETFKFDINSDINGISIKLKNNKVKNQEKYQLRKKALYKIYLPQNLAISTDKKIFSKASYFCFVTNSDDLTYKDCIMKSSSPINDQSSIDFNNANIEIDFIGDIKSDIDLKDYYKYITIEKKSILNPKSTYINESLDNFNINISGNKIIIEPKSKKLSDMYEYRINIKKDFIYLKDSYPIKIFNDDYNLNFSTDKLVVSSTPANNAENISINPEIAINFKGNIEDVNKDNVLLSENNNSSGSDLIPLEVMTSANKLKINLKSDLRANTLYKLTIKKGAIIFKDSPLVKNKEDINIYFVTSSEGDNPVPTKYSSDILGSDDITSIEKTNMSNDSSIYIKFDRPIKADDKNTDLLKGIKLYKIPTAQENAFGEDGVAFDKLFKFEKYINPNDKDSFKLSVTNDLNSYKEPMAIESARVDSTYTDTLVVKPKYPLMSLGQYEMSINKDYIEDLNGYNMKNDVDFRFYTKKFVSNEAPTWDVKNIKASDIKENKNLPYSSYVLHGIPNYSHENPIVINVKGEVIPNINKDFIEEIDTDSDGVCDSIVFKNYAMGEINLKETYQTVVQEEIENQVADDPINLKVNESKKLSLSSNITDSKDITWRVDDGSIATIDNYGNIQGRSKGETTAYALKDGTTIAKIKVVVNDSDLYIDNIDLEYYYSNGKKNTQIKLYPVSTLQNGKTYTLSIPSNVFESRNGNFLSKLSLDFVVNGDSSTDTGIYYLSGANTSLNELNDCDEFKFSIKGYNFYEKIESIKLTRADDLSKSVIILPKDIYFKGVDQIDVVIRDQTKQDLINLGDGNYKVGIKFADKTDLVPNQTDYPKELYFKIEKSSSKPILYNYYPTENGYYDENDLKHPVRDDFTNGKSFLRVTFKNENDDVLFGGISKLLETNVRIVGDNTSIIDTEFLKEIQNKNDLERDVYINKYLFIKDTSNKRVSVYIPIKTISDQYQYEVIVPKGIVTANAEENDAIHWNFNTKGTPSVSDVVVGSLVEDYDEDEPIILKGEFFNTDNITVYFGDKEADKVKIKKVENDNGVNEKCIYAYPPDKRLKPGIYDIKIYNGDTHETIIYGALSVIEEGRDVPEEKEFEQKDVSPYVIKSIKDKLYGRHVVSDFISYDMLRNSSNYINYNSTSNDLKVYRYDESTRRLYDVSFIDNKVDNRVYINNPMDGIYVVVE